MDIPIKFSVYIGKSKNDCKDQSTKSGECLLVHIKLLK
jgi:hypothetical protein